MIEPDEIREIGERCWRLLLDAGIRRPRHQEQEPPSDPAHVALAESQLGVAFPPDLKAMFEVADGGEVVPDIVFGSIDPNQPIQFEIEDYETEEEFAERKRPYGEGSAYVQFTRRLRYSFEIGEYAGLWNEPHLEVPTAEIVPLGRGGEMVYRVSEHGESYVLGWDITDPTGPFRVADSFTDILRAQPKLTRFAVERHEGQDVPHEVVKTFLAECGVDPRYLVLCTW